jgi:broad specificity phosphatase PhoE
VLLVVRHGRTAHNAGGLLLGSTDIPLDELGVRQAQALRSVRMLAGASRVVSSPLCGALDTANAIGPPVSVDERWREIDYGSFEGVPVAQAGELWERWSLDLSQRPPGGESLADVGARVRAACNDLWQEASRVDVVVVSHVSPIKVAVAWALGVGDEICWRTHLDTASISVIGPGRSGPSLRGFNITGHLPSA